LFGLVEVNIQSHLKVLLLVFAWLFESLLDVRLCAMLRLDNLILRIRFCVDLRIVDIENVGRGEPASLVK
jgi:hypothetical protein